MLKPRILIVDDRPENLKQAELQFQGKHVELTLCQFFSVAAEMLQTNKYDLVLTDLMMPGEQNGISNTNPDIGKDVPYGLILSIIAKNNGSNKVAILTDINHHSGPIAWAMDNILGKNPFISGYANKDWLKVAQRFLRIKNAVTDDKGTKKRPLLIIVNDLPLAKILKELFLEVEVVIATRFDALKTVTQSKPDYVIILGEIDPRAKETNHYVANLFSDIKKIISSEKISVAGFMTSEDPCYISLPVRPEDIAENISKKLKY